MGSDQKVVRKRGSERYYSELDTQTALQILHGDFSSFRNSRGDQLVKVVSPGVRSEPILRKQNQLSLCGCAWRLREMQMVPRLSQR